MSELYPVIGLEIHIELDTKAKMFCSCPAEHFNQEPNTLTCPVCLGLPGALPVPNQEAIKRTVQLALGLDCRLNEKTWFDRKNYFYPDLPKGYQISQFFRPIGEKGQLKVGEKTIGIKEIHLEEDTAKSLHQGSQRLLDFNKSGVPLIEVVSQPDITGSKQARQYAETLQRLVRHLKISPAVMAKGQMRLEANISLKEKPADELPDYRVELKNINSFRYLQQAIDYEINRQNRLLKEGKKIPQQTRGFNAKDGTTFRQRVKEEAYEYRYFPEPDIPPLQLNELFDLAKLKNNLPETPTLKTTRLQKEYNLSSYQARILVEKYPRAEKVLQIAQKENININDIANAIINKDFSLKKLTPETFVKKFKAAQDVKLITGKELKKYCRRVVEENPAVVAKYQGGKTSVLGFFIGQIQAKTDGKANATEAKQFLQQLLTEKVSDNDEE